MAEKWVKQKENNSGKKKKNRSQEYFIKQCGVDKEKQKKKYIKQVVKIQVNDMNVKKMDESVGYKSTKSLF